MKLDILGQPRDVDADAIALTLPIRRRI